MKKAVRINSFVLVLAIVLGLCPMLASAAETPIYNQFQYKLIKDNTQVEITGYVGSDSSITIPAAIDGKSVTSIGPACFYDANNRDKFDFITSIIIPPSVTHFGDYAFAGTSWLKDYEEVFVVVNGVLIDYKQANAVNVTVPETVKVIGYGAFDFCEMENITLPSGLEEIYAAAFYQCEKLRTVFLPEKVSFVSGSAFENCALLERITVDADNKHLSSVDGVLFDKAGKTLLCYPPARAATAYTVPAGTKVIGPKAFSACKQLTAVTLPEGLTSIQQGAFSYCSALTGIVFSNTVSVIEKEAFLKCGALKSLSLPDSVKTIGNEAFAFCTSLSSLKLPSALTVLSVGVFSRCYALKSVKIPDSVTKIDAWAFGECSSLNELVLGAGVKEIVGQAFISCPKLKTVRVSDKIEKIGPLAFGYTYDWNTSTAPKQQGFSIMIDNHDDVKYTDSAIFKYATSSGLPVSYARDFARKMGDMDGDGIVTAQDARLVLRASAGLETLSPLAKVAADTDKDKTVTAIDARKILRVSAKLDTFA